MEKVTLTPDHPSWRVFAMRVITITEGEVFGINEG